MNTDMNLSPSLESRVRALAANTPDDARLESAQQRLESTIRRRAPRSRSRRQGLAWIGAACTAVLAVALLLGPALTGYNDAHAFAAVQQQLRDFRTLEVTVEQTADGMALPTIHSWTDHAGNARTDIGQATSVIVNVRQRTMLTLPHGSHQALRMPLPANVGPTAGKALGWLDQVRRFQGRAERLPGTRMIDGYRTRGWVLRTGGGDIRLWADADGVPRAVDIGGKLHLHMKLTLNAPIDAATFSTRVPANYTLAPAQD